MTDNTMARQTYPLPIGFQKSPRSVAALATSPIPPGVDAVYLDFPNEGIFALVLASGWQAPRSRTTAPRDCDPSLANVGRLDWLHKATLQDHKVNQMVGFSRSERFERSDRCGVLPMGNVAGTGSKSRFGSSCSHGGCLNGWKSILLEKAAKIFWCVSDCASSRQKRSISCRFPSSRARLKTR
jgi:hypothetical protein